MQHNLFSPCKVFQVCPVRSLEVQVHPLELHHGLQALHPVWVVRPVEQTHDGCQALVVPHIRISVGAGQKAPQNIWTTRIMDSRMQN